VAVIQVPDLFIFAGENESYVFIGLLIFIIFIGLLGYDRLRGSSFGLDVKNKTNVLVQSRAVFLGCGLIGVAGSLLAIYYCFVIQASYFGINWTVWPLLILLVAGSSGGVGLFFGVLLLMGFQYLLILSREYFTQIIFFPIAMLNQAEIGLLILLSCFYFVKRTKNIESRVGKNES
jgi:ABC-type branched-subunit amino acid transport system permease subunit